MLWQNTLTLNFACEIQFEKGVQSSFVNQKNILFDKTIQIFYYVWFENFWRQFGQFDL